ncbi:MAG: hypothetical protein HYV75_01610 [Opitutae bacterium]|nr:hypothetical protein [Opitutae bacterium]
MTRGKRIALEILGPPALGAGLWYATITATTAWSVWVDDRPQAWNWQIAQRMGVVLLFAYIFAGLPSLLYAAIMEWRFTRGLNPGSWRAVAWSSGLGLASGLMIIGVASTGRAESTAYAMFGGLVLAVGFLLGWFIKRRSGTRERQHTVEG